MSYKLKLVSTALVMRIRIMSNEYFHTHADGNKRLDFQQHPLTLKVTQPKKIPVATMTKMERGGHGLD